MYKTTAMSDYNIECGWYKYPNGDNENGRLINVFKTTKKFVCVKIYNYYDNRVTPMDIAQNLVWDIRRKVEGDYPQEDGGWIYPNRTWLSISYKICDEYRI